MSSEKDTSSSTIASGIAGVLQFSLLHNKKVVESVKDMTQHRLLLMLHVFRMEQKFKERDDSALFSKTLMFEGYEITPAAREDLFKRLETDEKYDSFNSFERRLANWIIERNPYVNDVESPQPPASPRPHNAKELLQLGSALCVVISAIVAAQSPWYVGLVMGFIIATSYDRTIRQMNKESESSETSWLKPFSAGTEINRLRTDR
jgi:hypothetical protein